ncbi:hypothetical protein FRB96_008186, partial [Tulasnella sp. 330]
MRKAPTALARFPSLQPHSPYHRSLVTTLSPLTAHPHPTNPVVDKPIAAVQLPLPLATKNILRASSDLAQRSIPNPELWTTSANRALADLCQPRKPVVAVYGDLHSGARDIVTALLEDPLSGDQEKRNALTGRHDATTHPPKPLSITYDEQCSRTDASLRLRAPWLEKANVTVLEVPELDINRSLQALLTADHVVLVTDNIRFLTQPHIASLVRTFAHHPSSQLLLNRVVTSSTTVRDDEAELSRQLNRLLYPENTQVDNGPPTMQISTASSTEALDALDIFRNTQSSSLPSSARAASLEVYQRKSLASSLSSLATQIAAAVRPRHPTLASSDLYYTQSATAAFLVSRILHACQVSLSGAQSEISHVEHRIDLFRTKTTEDRIDLEASFTGVDPPCKASTGTRHERGDTGEGLPLVEGEMARCESAAYSVLRDQLTWWALLRGKVDDVGDVMRDVVIDDYGRELEKKIVFLCGRLASTQRKCSYLSTELVTFPPSSPFHSPVLTNILAQQQQLDGQTLSTSSPPLPTYTANLLQPINTRRDQILSQLIPQLHSRAQLLLLRLYLITVTSTGSALAGWISGIEWVTGDVAVGLGALGVVAGARWSVGRWDKARQRFWKGWRRIGQGLSRDIQ